MQFIKQSGECIPCILAYGHSGTNKTGIIQTAHKPMVVMSRPTSVRLNGTGIHTLYCENLKELKKAVKWCIESDEALEFGWHCFDSISEWAEKEFLRYEDTSRKAYLNIQSEIMQIFLDLTTLPKRPVYCTAWAKTVQDGDISKEAYGFPGQALAQKIPPLFSTILRFHPATNDEGDTELVAQTQANPTAFAKDESGNLDPIEKLNLTTILEKIQKGRTNV